VHSQRKKRTFGEEQKGKKEAETGLLAGIRKKILWTTALPPGKEKIPKKIPGFSRGTAEKLVIKGGGEGATLIGRTQLRGKVYITYLPWPKARNDCLNQRDQKREPRGREGSSREGAS